MCQASLAVAHAAAELAGSDTSDLQSVPASLTSQQLEEMEQLRRTVTSLHGELEVLRSMNTELQNEIEAVVRIVSSHLATKKTRHQLSRHPNSPSDQVKLSQ